MRLTTSNFEVIVTLNKLHCTKKSLIQFVKLGASIFRINGSHTPVKVADWMLRQARKAIGSKAKILIDLPGSKIRLSRLSSSIRVRAGVPFKLQRSMVSFPEFFDYLTKDQLLLTKDGTLPFRLVHKEKEQAVFIPQFSGTITRASGINIQGFHPPIPFLHESDYALIEFAIKHGVNFVGFSYVRSPGDVQQALRSIRGTKVQMICKIETREACKNLGDILPYVDVILVDRGDLSSEIGLHQVPSQVKRIIEAARARKKKIFLATQFLHYMVDHPVPSISEVVALHEALELCDGLQLSEETTIGKHAHRAVEVICEALRVVRQPSRRASR